MRSGWRILFLAVLILALPWVGWATTIYEIQYNETDQGSGEDCYPSPWYDQSVTFSGVVTHVGVSTGYADFWLQDPNDPMWSGVFVYDDTIEPSVGDSLTLTASVDEYFGLTEIKDISDLTEHSSDNPPPQPVDVSTGDLAGGCNAVSEAYEGMLVRVRDVIVTQAPNSYGEWYVDDGSGECQIDDFIFTYSPSPTVGQSFDAIVGLIHYSHSAYELLPRNAGDLIEEQTDPPVISGTEHQPESPQPTDMVVVTSQVIDNGTVSSVTLFYSTNGGSSWSSTIMNDEGAVPDQTAGDDIYTSRIGEQAEGTRVDYYIRAVDDEALESYDPANAPIGTYSYTVAGGQEGDGTGTATIAPDSVGLSQTVSATIAMTGDGTNTLAAVTVVVPGNWSWSQAVGDVELAGEGFTGAAVQVAGDDILITGAALTDADVGQVTITDLTSPGTATTSTFTVKTAVAGGNPAAIASSPTVKVGGVGPEFVPIADIQADPSEYEGQIVTIRGVVTIGAGVLDDNYTRAYVQDESGKGINVFEYDQIGELVRGRLVEITGTIEDYLASGASYPVTEITDVTVTVLQENQPLPDPVLLSTGAANDPQWDGTWIMVSGVMVEPPYYAGVGYNVNVDDGSGQITIRIWDTTGIDVSEFAQGDTITAIGAQSLYRTTFQILTGYQEDIWEGPPDITGPPTISQTDHQPDSPLYTDPVVVTSRVTDDGSVSAVTLYYSTNGGSSWNFTAMNDDGAAPDQTAGDDIYTAQIGAQPEGTNVRYYIRAVDDETQQSFDPTNAPTSYYSYTVRGGMPGDGSGTASISPDSVELSQAVSETLTVVGDGSHTLISVAVIVPQSWSWPAGFSSVELAGAGFSGADGEVSSDTITITGATVTDGDIGQVIVNELTAPGTATTSTFTVKTAVDGGVLAEIASSPQVTVGAGESEYTDIADIQANVEEYEGTVVTLKAVVTIGAGVLDDQYTRAYVQDESGRGINLFDFEILPEITRGNLVEVTGTIEDYLASGAIAAVTEITDISALTVLETDQPLPDPIILSTGGAQSDEWDGTWIQVTGVMQEDPYFAGGGSNLNIDDGTGRYTIRIWETTGIDVSEFAEGDTITAIGAGSVYGNSYQMLTGYQTDIYEGPAVAEGIGYASIDPSSVESAAQGLTETITLWSDADHTLIELSVEIPASWTWNQPDESAIQLSGGGFPEGTTVEISGERTIRIHDAAVTATDQGILAIMDLEAPEIGEISTFRIKTAPAGQPLKEIETSPRVTVKGLDKARLSIVPRVFVPNRRSYADAEGFVIEFNVPTNSDVVLRLYDIEGRVVRTLVDEEQYAGPGQAIWNGRDELREVVPIGVYICHLEATDRDKGSTTTDQAPIVVGTPLD
jgi:hypothetical protein